MSTVEEKTVETGFGDDAFKKVEGPRKRKSDKMDEQGFQFCNYFCLNQFNEGADEEERPYFAPITAEKMASGKKKAPDVRTGEFCACYFWRIH